MNYIESGKFNCADFLVLDIKNQSQFFKATNDMILNKEYNLYIFDFTRSNIFKEAQKEHYLKFPYSDGLALNPSDKLKYLNLIHKDLKNYVVTTVDIPFEDKDEFKKLFNGKWCAKSKTWYFLGDKYEKIYNYCVENNKNWQFTYNGFFTQFFDVLKSGKTYNELNRDKPQSKQDIKSSKPETKPKAKYENINFDSDSD